MKELQTILQDLCKEKDGYFYKVITTTAGSHFANNLVHALILIVLKRCYCGYTLITNNPTIVGGEVLFANNDNEQPIQFEWNENSKFDEMLAEIYNTFKI